MRLYEFLASVTPMMAASRQSSHCSSLVNGLVRSLVLSAEQVSQVPVGRGGILDTGCVVRSMVDCLRLEDVFVKWKTRSGISFTRRKLAGQA